LGFVFRVTFIVDSQRVFLLFFYEYLDYSNFSIPRPNRKFLAFVLAPLYTFPSREIPLEAANSRGALNRSVHIAARLDGRARVPYNKNNSFKLLPACDCTLHIMLNIPTVPKKNPRYQTNQHFHTVPALKLRSEDHHTS
jgi:hypothetical protein